MKKSEKEIKVKTINALGELIEMNRNIKVVYESKKFIIRIKKVLDIKEIIKKDPIIIVISKETVVRTPPNIKIFNRSLIDIIKYIKSKNIFLDLDILEETKEEYVTMFKKFCVTQKMYGEIINIFLLEAEIIKK